MRGEGGRGGGERERKRERESVVGGGVHLVCLETIRLLRRHSSALTKGSQWSQLKCTLVHKHQCTHNYENMKGYRYILATTCSCCRG